MVTLCFLRCLSKNTKYVLRFKNRNENPRHVSGVARYLGNAIARDDETACAGIGTEIEDGEARSLGCLSVHSVLRKAAVSASSNAVNAPLNKILRMMSVITKAIAPRIRIVHMLRGRVLDD